MKWIMIGRGAFFYTVVLFVAILAGFPTVPAIAQQLEQYGVVDLKEGIYGTFEELRLNAPGVPMDRLKDQQGQPVTDLRQVSGKLHWQPDTGKVIQVDPRSIWGFCQNDVVYVAAGNGFYRIGLMGSLAHLMVEETYYVQDPFMYGTYGQGVSQTVMVQQLLDMRSGSLLPFSAASMDKALQEDPLLLDEFRALPKKKRNSAEALFTFLRLYNDRHPLEFPSD